MSEALVARLRARGAAPPRAEVPAGGDEHEQQLERVLPRLRAAAGAKKRAEGRGSDRRELLRTLLRRLCGRLAVRGRLLNLDELLVVQLAPLGAKEGCVSIADSGVRLVVRCVGAAAAQVGQQRVTARLVAPEDPRVQEILAGDDIGATYDGLTQQGGPAVALVSTVDEVGAAVWTKETPLEGMTSVFGFELSAFEMLQQYTLPDREGEVASLNEHLTSLRSFRDLRASEKMMELFGTPNDRFQSFALCQEGYPRTQQDGEFDPWSYRELDATQKRKWADERYEYGLELVEKRKFREAVAEFDNAIKLHGQHAQSLAAKGRAYFAMHQLQDAVDWLDQAIKIDPSDPAVSDDLLRAKGALDHSRHVSSTASNSMAPTSILRHDDRTESRNYTSKRESSQDTRKSSHDRNQDNGRRSVVSAKTLEENRLRTLLEEEARQRKRTHRSHRSRRSASDSVSDSNVSERSRSRSRSRERSRSSSKKRKREKKHKKEKRSHKKHSRKKSKKSSRYDSDSSAYSSDTNRQRGRKREKSGERDEEERSDSLPAILSRTKHRIWN